jgi:uncharacterized protein YgbK (DUF1537 family)
MALTIVADDLTGACDTGTLFAARGPVPVAVWPRSPGPAEVRVVDTETRALAPAEAARRVGHAVAAAPAGTRWFKKIDSTLRGHVAVEVQALLESARAGGAVLTPAFPAQGRTVRGGVLVVDGTPLAETTLAADPEFPAGRPASIPDLLAPLLRRPLVPVPLDRVRAGAGPLAACLAGLEGAVAVADAETDDDLLRLVDAVLALDRAPVLVGAAGLARALAARLGLLAEGVALPAGRRWLLVAGSRHPATRRQVAAARAAGLRVLASPDDEDPDRAGVAARLAAEARRVLERERFDLVAVTGGQTAAALFEALEAERIDLVGAPAPGLALGYLRAPGRAPLPLLTKAGGFGAPDLYVSLLAAVSR